MLLERLRLTNVRNHRRLEVAFAPGITVLSGGNGAGKTSVLEAAHLMLRGFSPRTSSPREVITHGESFLRVEGDLTSGRQPVTAAFGYDVSGERRATRNGAPLEDLGRWEEEIPVRVFLPDHLQLVKGSPRRRRHYLDVLCLHADPSYRRVLADYEEALRQRNYLLRQGRVGEEHSPWEGILAREGLELARRRARTLTGFSGLFTQAHAELALAAPPIMLLYRTNVAEVDGEAYRAALVTDRPADRRRTHTRLGPHRDDLRFVLEGRDLREYGSQGEQRTVLLALLLAEREWLRVERGLTPLLLLDDVMSELDFERRRRLLALLFSEGQAVVTTTTMEYFTSEELARISVVELGRTSERVTGGLDEAAG